jgi:transcriptional regulator with XRE-family HTH domain
MKRHQKTDKAIEIGKRIAEARKEAGGMTQEELGELVGVSVRSIAAWELGDVIPYRHLKELEKATGVTAAWLLHGEESTDVRDQQLEEISSKLDEILRRLDRGEAAPSMRGRPWPPPPQNA